MAYLVSVRLLEEKNDREKWSERGDTNTDDYNSLLIKSHGLKVMHLRACYETGVGALALSSR